MADEPRSGDQPAAERPSPRPTAGDGRDWHTVIPLIIGLVSFAGLALLNEVRDFTLWRNYAVMGMVLGSPVTWAIYRLDLRVPWLIQWVIVVGLWLHYGGGSTGSPGPHGEPGLFGMHGINGTYHVFGWWDNLTHFMGMGAAALAAGYLLEVYQLRRRLGWPAWLVASIAWASGLAIGVGVELYEYLGKTLFQTIDQGGFRNTMADLGWNIIGATIGSFVAVQLTRKWRVDRMVKRWGAQRPQPASPLLPSSMLGYLAFILPAATMAIYLVLIVPFATGGDTIAAYDDALNRLTASAVVGFMAGPFLNITAREIRSRR